MNVFIGIIFGIMLNSIGMCDSYVVMQVRKGNNESKVDAYIHKVVPDASASQRKQLTNFKRFEIRKRAEEDQTGGEESEDQREPRTKDLESVILSIDTGVKPGQRPPLQEKKEEAFDRIQQALKGLVKLDNPNNLMFRAQEEYNIKPKIIHFKAREQPSLKVEINSQSILKALNDLLSSHTVRRYADVAARKAAVVYRSFANEMAREDEPRPVYRH